MMNKATLKAVMEVETGNEVSIKTGTGSMKGNLIIRGEGLWNNTMVTALGGKVISDNMAMVPR